MRIQKNAALRYEKKYQKELRIKKWLMILSVLVLVFGLLAVDRGYSDMMDEKGRITPTVRRTDDETVVVSVFGMDIHVNTEDFDIQIVEPEEEDQ